MDTKDITFTLAKGKVELAQEVHHDQVHIEMESNHGRKPEDRQTTRGKLSMTQAYDMAFFLLQSVVEHRRKEKEQMGDLLNDLLIIEEQL